MAECLQMAVIKWGYLGSMTVGIALGNKPVHELLGNPWASHGRTMGEPWDVCPRLTGNSLKVSKAINLGRGF